MLQCKHVSCTVLASWLVRWTPDRAVRAQGLAGTLRYVLGQDTLLSQCLSSLRCINGYRRIYCWGYPWDGLAFHPGKLEILLVASCYQNCVHVGMMEPLGLYADFFPFVCVINTNFRLGILAIVHNFIQQLLNVSKLPFCENCKELTRLLFCIIFP